MRILSFDHTDLIDFAAEDLDHAPTRRNDRVTITWDPNAVAPPLGDVYEREDCIGNWMAFLGVICIGAFLAGVCIVLERLLSFNWAW
jgi:hypothetical protein